jgi:hypothetical protein
MIKMRPRNSCQYSGIATVKMLFACCVEETANATG